MIGLGSVRPAQQIVPHDGALRDAEPASEILVTPDKKTYGS